MFLGLAVGLLLLFGAFPDHEGHDGNLTNVTLPATMNKVSDQQPRKFVNDSLSFKTVEEASEKVPGWTWAVELQNHANVSLKYICTNMSGLALVQGKLVPSNSELTQIDGARLGPGESVWRLYSVKTNIRPKLQSIVQIESTGPQPPMNLLYGINWPYNYAFDMTLTNPTEWENGGLTFTNKGNYTKFQRKSDYLVTAHVKDVSYKLMVVIRVEKAQINQQISSI